MGTLRSLLGSIILHGLLIGAMLLCLNPKKPLSSFETVQFDIVSGSPRGAGSAQGSKNSTKKQSAAKAAQTLLHANTYGYASPVEVSQPGTEREGEWREYGYTTKDNPNVAWGAGGGTFERIQDAVLMKYFHQKVDAMLFYPGILARHKISGGASSRIVINEDGSCNWSLTKISAGDPHLRIFVLHILKNVCTENFKKYTAKRELTNVDMSFIFSITERPTTDELIQSNQKIVGNVLLFYRNSHQSVAEWHLGPFRGMFPIPWVGVDFGWIMENFDKYVKKNDPMKEYSEPILAPIDKAT